MLDKEEIIKLTEKGITEQQIDKLVNKELKKLSEEEINAIGKKRKNINIAIYVFLMSMVIGLLVYGIVSCSISKDWSNLKPELIMCGLLLLIIHITINVKNLFKNNDWWTRDKIRGDINSIVFWHRRKMRQNTSNNRFYYKKIKEVFLLDTHTSWSDKMHVVMNYQEIIQTRYCKFKVVYEDGSFDVVDVQEYSEEYDELIKYLKVNETSKETSVSKADELRKYKQLLDEGIITKEEFEKKKKELL